MIRKLYIEPTSLCNLNCIMCFRHTWMNEKMGHMDLELFYKAIRDEKALEKTETIFFGGMGEP